MAGIVLKAAQAAGGSGGDPIHQVVQVADAAAHIMDVVRSEAAKNKEAARVSDNEFNIRKNFLDNAVGAIKDATLSQYNIVICTDQEHDDFQDLQGRILPMDLLNVEIASGKFVNFQVYVFETGKYLRRGRWEKDAWNWWGENKKWTDIFMHVHFETAQQKLDAAAIKKLQDQKAAEEKAANDAAAAAKAAQDKAAAVEAAGLKKEADKKAADDAAKTRQGGGAGNRPTYGGGFPTSSVGGWDAGVESDPYASPDFAPNASPYASSGYDQSGPAPSFTSHLANAAVGPAMQMLMPSFGMGSTVQ